MQFHRDVVIDLVCYRRLGHNEQDEPMVTQPLMYKRIAKLPTTRKLYADKLQAEGVIGETDAEDMIAMFRKALDTGHHTNKTILENYKPPFSADWAKYIGHKWNELDDTRLPLEKLKALAERITAVPDNLKLHPRVRRSSMIGGRWRAAKLPLDWGMAEHLAYATLLEEGYSIRLSGQDSGPRTFFHRHAVLHDQNRERWDAGHVYSVAARERQAGRFRRDRFAAFRRGGGRLRIRLCDVRVPTSSSSGKRSSAISPTVRRS